MSLSDLTGLAAIKAALNARVGLGRERKLVQRYGFDLDGATSCP